MKPNRKPFPKDKRAIHNVDIGVISAYITAAVQSVMNCELNCVNGYMVGILMMTALEGAKYCPK